jgi:putative hydrolase of HD superfamily
MPDEGRLAQQIQFIVELDQLKQVLRQTSLVDGSRRENSAEHSWHLTVMALVLGEYAPPEIDLLRVLKMLVVHDVVEIRAGDTFCYDSAGNLDKAEREQAAAAHLFGLLPSDLGSELRGLWEEFEAGLTPEARFANALDRLQPLLHNVRTDGGTWRKHGIMREQVLQRMRPIQDGAPSLWPYVLRVIEESCTLGYIRP